MKFKKFTLPISDNIKPSVLSFCTSNAQIRNVRSQKLLKKRREIFEKEKAEAFESPWKESFL